MATIRTAQDKVPATVAGFGKVKDGNYGPYQSVLFEGDRLPDGKVWRSMEPEQAKQFTRGQRVHLVPTKNKQGRDSWDIELLGESPQLSAVAPVATRAAAPTDLSPEQKRAIAAYITARAPLLTYCHQQAAAAMGDAGEVAIAAGAAALFEAACRRFEV